MKQEMRIVILSAVLAFLGSTVGAFLSFQLGEKAWEREVQYDHKKFTVQQRIKLVERLAKAVASLDEIQKNIELIEIDRNARTIALEQGQSPPVISEVSERLSNRLVQIEAEYSAVLSLLQVFYGPKTNNSVNKLIAAKVWYKPKEEDILKLYDAIGQELYWFP